MSHRRAKRLRKIIGPSIPKRVYRAIKRGTRRQELPTLKELHNADVHADIPNRGE